LSSEVGFKKILITSNLMEVGLIPFIKEVKANKLKPISGLGE